MNKIYRVMYSKVKQCAVVVSEIAKNRSKRVHSSVVREAALRAALLSALASFSWGMPVAQAADVQTTDATSASQDTGTTTAEDTIYHAGWGITIGVVTNEDGTVTKNTISLGRNLGNNLDADPDEYTLEAVGNGSIVLGESIEDFSGPDSAIINLDNRLLQGQTEQKMRFGTYGAGSVTVGGADNAITENGADGVAVGGYMNIVDGQYGVSAGGDQNLVLGNATAVFGGSDNISAGNGTVVIGGFGNRAANDGDHGSAGASVAVGGVNNASLGYFSVVAGGRSNYAFDNGSSAFGGTGSLVWGENSVGIGGGIVGGDNGIAIGHQSVDNAENSVAIGYQSTTSDANTISFGHDKGDISGVTLKWQQRTDTDISGNILTNTDGTTNDYTQPPTITGTTTYASAAYNRLVKVADGQDAHDVVVMEQLKDYAKADGSNLDTSSLTSKLATGTIAAGSKGLVTGGTVYQAIQNLKTSGSGSSSGSGSTSTAYKAGNGLELDETTNTISLNRNLSLPNSNNSSLEAKGENALILGGERGGHAKGKLGAYGRSSVLVGGVDNLIEDSGSDAVIVSGDANKASGEASAVVGGQGNTASGQWSVVAGGNQNEASGNFSAVMGGELNYAIAEAASVSGGLGGYAMGEDSSVGGGQAANALGIASYAAGGYLTFAQGVRSTVIGGFDNAAIGNNASAIGGRQSVVQGTLSIGLAGGSTAVGAGNALAAGYGAVVTEDGVKRVAYTPEEQSSGEYAYDNAIENGEQNKAPKTVYKYQDVATAVGYQATADETNTVAFGHDKGDVSGYNIKWNTQVAQKADGTYEVVAQTIDSIEETKYTEAKYNRLVKVADGIKAHDTVVMEQLRPYLKSDASNVGSNLKTYTVGDDGETITPAEATDAQKKDNEDAWAKALGTGTINGTNDQQLVTGETVLKALQGLSQPTLPTDTVKLVKGDRVTITPGTDEKGTTTYTISANNNGKVEAGNTDLVSGDTMYNELRPSKDGRFIRKGDTTAENLKHLDEAIQESHDNGLVQSDGKTVTIGSKDTATKIDVRGQGKDGKPGAAGRIVTGVVTDARDMSSAANVGYVNGVTAANTQQIYRDMNNAYGRLNNNINKAAAGSNALAALHPLDYDPDDKADFAVGYGHYRNANAAAVGAFYHPNENTMVNVGVSLGNGDPGFNAGVSFKIGSGSAGRQAMSKTEMAKVINSQSKEIDALKKDNADKDKRIDALEQKMAEILAKLDKNGQ